MTEFNSSSGTGRIGLDRMSVLLAQADFDLAEPYLSKLIEAYGYVRRTSARVHSCCGFDADGIPHSLQIVGRLFDETTVLRAGDAYEKATSWRDRRPDIQALATQASQARRNAQIA